MSDRPKALVEAQNRALREENERLLNDARRYFTLQARLPGIVQEAIGAAEGDDELAGEYARGDATTELSGNHRPVHEMLDEHLDATLANPSRSRLIAEATVKTDRFGTNCLVHLHAGMLTESYVPEDETREL
jgi:hypothetical protein